MVVVDGFKLAACFKAVQTYMNLKPSRRFKSSQDSFQTIKCGYNAVQQAGILAQGPEYDRGPSHSDEGGTNTTHASLILPLLQQCSILEANFNTNLEERFPTDTYI